MRSDLRALVVLPTFNESQNIRSIVERILATPEFGVLIVDDHSPDGTGRIADELSAAHPGRVDVLHRDGVRGLGLSYREGFAAAIESGVPVIVQMDADWSHDPMYLPAMHDATRIHDVVVGSRYVPGGAVVDWPRRRRLLSVWANRYIRLITRLAPKDCTSGFRAWRRETLARRWTLEDIPLRTGGPARYVRLRETGQRVGFITPLTHNFCEGCNRVRVTCTGMLYMCLGQDDSADLRAPLRASPDDEPVREAIRWAIARKPKGHDFDYSRKEGGFGQVGRHMSVTGG